MMSLNCYLLTGFGAMQFINNNNNNNINNKDLLCAHVLHQVFNSHSFCIVFRIINSVNSVWR